MGRRLICQWWVMTSVKTVSEQQDSVRSSSSTTHSCVLEAWLARTLARVIEAVLWCVHPSMIPTPMFRRLQFILRLHQQRLPDLVRQQDLRAERQEGLRRQVRQDLREDDRRVQQVLC